jgi:hypothetical protein
VGLFHRRALFGQSARDLAFRYPDARFEGVFIQGIILGAPFVPR